MKNTDVVDDDNEFARYLASYLKEREDYFVVTDKWHEPSVNVYQLEATIRKFISELP